MRSNRRLAASVAIVGLMILALGAVRASSELPFISDCCGCGSVLAPDFDQAQPVNPPNDELGYWFVVEECQAALAGRTREVIGEVAVGAALLGGAVAMSTGTRRRSPSAATTPVG